MKESKFQITGLRLKKFEFNINEDFNIDKMDGLKIDTKTEIERFEGNAKINLKVNIFEKKEEFIETAPFFIKVVMEGIFEWDITLDDEMLKYLLNSNAPAILFSYIRPHILNITVSAGFPPVILPLMDFTENEIVNSNEI
ncbi:MAG TPA: hypothetical protein DCP90_00430 [Clostridiales bacterium]|nr:MAG: hypothetical protein A2Y22_08145 [Clostridiales bacterium GWD2_32_59]HAN09062.1 hypothetical protein [Clostridiales bacterium]